MPSRAPLTGCAVQATKKGHSKMNRPHAVLAILLCLYIGSFARADDSTPVPKFSDYPVPVYAGALHIPPYYKQDSDGAWRDDLGKEVAPVCINFAGRYYLGVHSCGTECRYFTLSDLSTGRDSKALNMFSTTEGEPLRTRDGRTYVTELAGRPDSKTLVARYRIDGSADRPAECRERLFLLSEDGRGLRPITPTRAECR